MAQSILSKKYRDSLEESSGPSETLYEVYYLMPFGDYVTCTPVVQYVHHPLGETDAEAVLTAGLRMVLSF